MAISIKQVIKIMYSSIINHLIPSFLTQLLMYFTVLLLYFQMDIWIQEYINGGIKATFQGSDMSGNAENKRQALVIKNMFNGNGRPSCPKQGLPIGPSLHCYYVFYSLVTYKGVFKMYFVCQYWNLFSGLWESWNNCLNSAIWGHDNKRGKEI